ncbi:MAG: extracellular solute-binding protein, partial [Myxococcales bacterium]
MRGEEQPRLRHPSHAFLRALASPLLAALALLFALPASAQPVELVLWHSYNGAEKDALNETVASFNAQHRARGVQLTTLPIPNDAFADKLTAAIAVGNGPDLFVFAHDRLGDWADQGLVEPLQNWIGEEHRARFTENSLRALGAPQGSRTLYGLPLAVKSVALIYDSSKVPTPPATIEALEAEAKKHTGNGSYGFVFDWGTTYQEAGFFHAFGGGVLDRKGQPTLDAPGNVAAVKWVRKLREDGLLPREVSGALVGALFNDRKAAMIITGPWALKDLKADIPFKVASLPAGPAGPARPFLGVEALIMSSRSRHKAEALQAMLALTSDEAAKVRLTRAQQPVANRGAWADVDDHALQGFRAQSELAEPMPSAPAMRHVWSPMDAALSRALAQGVDAQTALAEGQRRVSASVAATEEQQGSDTAAEGALALARRMIASGDLFAGESARQSFLRLGGEGAAARWCEGKSHGGSGLTANPVDTLVLAAATAACPASGTPASKADADLADRALALGGDAVRWSADRRELHAAVAGADGTVAIVQLAAPKKAAVVLYAAAALLLVLSAVGFLKRRQLAPHLGAWAYVAPAVAGVIVLIFVPFGYGLSLGFYDVSPTRERFVGFKNFADILLLRNGGDAHSFYFTFGMTVLWTVVNVFLHLVIGLFLALILQDSRLRLQKAYRVLLIIPWAIPNYITALIWKAMFNAEYGLINKVFGLGSFSWFESPVTAFCANLVTNVWLGFPFMMVTALGALQSIPRDLYEAADVDGAGRWRKFTDITLPLLKPALFPAVILGTIWTFNLSFNVIYLVSGGAPDGATDILVTQAFRYAFEQYRYGYAAAYATIIFGILLTYTLITNRITKATEGAF